MVRLGERLGLTGQDLARFIKEKEEHIAREESAQRRENERKHQEMQFQLHVKEQELEIERLRAGRGNNDNSSSKALGPKLPKFDEKQDDMDEYIERFERFAQSQQWSEETWAVSLSSLLTGKGLEVYTSMPPSDAGNYKSLKVAVLKRYQLTEEGFRSKFRTNKPDQGETVFQYAARMRRYFMRWTEMAGEDNTYEALCDLMIKKQFIRSCSTDLALFLRERAPKSMEGVIRLAEQYTEAHGGRMSTNANKPSAGPQMRQKEERPAHPSSKPPTKEIDERRKDKICFVCNRKCHIAKECKTLKTDRKVSAACAQVKVPYTSIEECTENGLLKLANGDTFPIISAGCTIEMLEGKRNLDIQTGFVGDREVKVLRDTGSEMAAVRRELVSEDQMLKKKIIMIPIDGQARMVSVARIHIDTPYYTGETEAMVPTSLICDLVLGNIPGVADKPSKTWIAQGKVAAAVMTRSQRKKAEQPLKALHVSEPSCDREINVGVLQKAQKGCVIEETLEFGSCRCL